jgi:hypothetical protein
VEDMPNNLIIIDGKKFVRDGVDYTNEEEASKKMQKYKDDGFEVELSEGDGKSYLYTRRVVKEVIVQNA